jgi:hypothetical protein
LRYQLDREQLDVGRGCNQYDDDSAADDDNDHDGASNNDYYDDGPSDDNDNDDKSAVERGHSCGHLHLKWE